MQDKNRVRSILQNAVATGLARVVGALVGLLMVPLTLGYLGAERYGLWMALSSLVAFLQITDGGIGNALIGVVARNQAQAQGRGLLQITTSALSMLSLVGLAITACFFLLEPLIDWQRFLNYSDAVSQVEVHSAIRIFIFMFAVGLPLSVPQQIRLGLLQGARNGRYLAAGQVANLGFVATAIFFKAGLPWLVFASMLGTMLAGAANLGAVLIGFLRHGNAWRPSRETMWLLLGKGGLFFVLQVCALVSYNADNLIVSNVVGAKSVSQYSIAMKIFSTPSILFSLLLSGMWPAYADAEARGDRAWAASFFWKTTRRMFVAGLLISTVLLCIAPWAFSILTKGQIKPEANLLLGMFLWGMYLALGGAVATLLNGLHVVYFQVVIAVICTILNIVASIWLAKLVGVPGPIYGSVLAMTVQYGIAFWYIRKNVFGVGRDNAR